MLSNEGETFRSMPEDITIDSLDGQLTKKISVKTCPCKVTGSYKMEDWGESKKRWPYLRECEFAKPANDGTVDLLVGVDNPDLHYFTADVRGREGGPIPRSVHWAGPASVHQKVEIHRKLDLMQYEHC